MHFEYGNNNNVMKTDTTTENGMEKVMLRPAHLVEKCWHAPPLHRGSGISLGQGALC